jgi:tripartite-type tricarboxylate transporter receptor subunit TctC
MNRRELLRMAPALSSSLVGAAWVSQPLMAQAQSANASYPSKPLRYIVPVAAGGGSDMVGRTVCERWSKALNQTILVDNQGGGGGVIACQSTARAAPDGYTLLMAVDSVPANPHLYKGLTYDTFKDLQPVTMLARVPLVLITHPKVPATNLPELVKYIRQQDGKFAYASPGTGTSNHLYMELFKSVSNTDMIHVPYKGGSPAMNDLMGGQVDAMLISVTLAMPQIKAGKVQAIAVTSDKRLPSMPQVSTFTEAGYADFTPHTWGGLFAPAGTSAPILQKLHAEVAKVARTPEVVNRLRDLGAEVVMNSPAEFGAQLKSSYDKMGELIKVRKIVGE